MYPIDMNGYGYDIFKHRKVILSALIDEKLPRDHFFTLLQSIKVSDSIGTDEKVVVNLLESYVRFYSNEVSEKIRCILAILPGIEDTQQKKTAILDALEPLLRRSKGLPMKIQKSLRDVALTYIFEDGLNHTPFPDYEDVEDIPADIFVRNLRVRNEYKKVTESDRLMFTKHIEISPAREIMDRMFGWTPEIGRQHSRKQIQKEQPTNDQCTDKEILEAKQFWEYGDAKEELVKYLNLQFNLCESLYKEIEHHSSLCAEALDRAYGDVTVMRSKVFEADFCDVNINDIEQVVERMGSGSRDRKKLEPLLDYPARLHKNYGLCFALSQEAPKAYVDTMSHGRDSLSAEAIAAAISAALESQEDEYIQVIFKETSMKTRNFFQSYQNIFRTLWDKTGKEFWDKAVVLSRELDMTVQGIKQRISPS